MRSSRSLTITGVHGTSGWNTKDTTEPTLHEAMGIVTLHAGTVKRAPVGLIKNINTEQIEGSEGIEGIEGIEGTKTRI